MSSNLQYQFPLKLASWFRYKKASASLGALAINPRVAFDQLKKNAPADWSFRSIEELDDNEPADWWKVEESE
jgi:hypothetical protein